MFNQTQSVTVE